MEEIKQQVEILVARIEKCIKGEKFSVKIEELPIDVHVHLFWDNELSATNLFEIDFDEDRMSEAEGRLWQFMQISYDLEVCPIFDDRYLAALPSFQETKQKIDVFNKEVEEIMAALVVLSSQFPAVFASLSPLLCNIYETANSRQPERT